MKDFISETELKQITWRCQKRIQRQFGVIRGHEEQLRQMIHDEILLIQDPSLINQKTSEHKETVEELKERDSVENEIFEAILDLEHPKPSWADYERLKKADPDIERPPKRHRDSTVKKTGFYVEKGICEVCNHTLENCVCGQNKKSTLQVW